MELHVFKNTAIRDISEQFSRYFPFLRLEFFIYRHHTEDDQFTKEVYKGLYLEETSDFFKEGTICFSPSTTISDFEQEFQIELGLAVKVYRKSVDAWVDTSQTAHLSLGKQNTMGAAVARPYIKFHTFFL